MGVDLCKKPKDLSASEREERGHGEGVISNTEPRSHSFLISDTEPRSHSFPPLKGVLVYYKQQMKWELKEIHVIWGCRYNERLKVKTDGSTYLTYTGLCGELEHLKIETRLIGESFVCVTGECVI